MDTCFQINPTDNCAVMLADGTAATPTLGHCEYFIMYKHQATPSLLDGCRV